MTALTLFDLPSARPISRTSDPTTSWRAGESAADGVHALELAIVSALLPSPTPLSAFDIARWIQAVHGARWDEGTVRTRVSAMHKHDRIRYIDDLGQNRGRSVRRYVLKERS